jgi:hypothetical protein
MKTNILHTEGQGLYINKSDFLKIFLLIYFFEICEQSQFILLFKLNIKLYHK